VLKIAVRTMSSRP